MNAKTSRRLAAIEGRLAESRSTAAEAPLLAWLARKDARRVLEAAAAGEVYTLPDDLRRAGLALRRAMSKRLASTPVETMTRAELAALVVSGAASTP